MTDTKFTFDPSKPDSIDNLQVVFKVVERCNINCSYCYYFNMGDNTAMERPPLVSTDIAELLARWIAQGCRDLRIPKVLISFHGGEPMMLKPRNFGAVCEVLRRHISPVAELTFSMQTNGTILNEEWLALFDEYGVRVGVSIDGDREAHDRYRLDHRARSTFERTEENLKRLADWAQGNPRMMPSTISVLDPANDYRKVYKFLRQFGVEQMNFLLPDRNADSPLTGPDGSSAAYGRALFEIFDAWLTEDNPDVYIKYVHKTLGHFQLNRKLREMPEGNAELRRSKGLRKEYQVIVARSDGSVAVNDSYIPALPWYQETPVNSIFEHSLQQFLGDRVFREIEAAESTLPSGCRSCRWKTICKGGDLENRFSTKSLFDNPSVYCDGYKLFYQNVCDLLSGNGYPIDAVQDRFVAAAE